MVIEISILVTLISVSFAVFFGIQNFQRNKKADTAADAVQITTVLVKLENISTGIMEIKAEISGIQKDLKEIWERLILNEAASKQAHKRLDNLTKGGG